MVELIRVKSSALELVKQLIRIERPLLKEYYSSILTKEEFLNISFFLKKEIVIEEIKEKKYEFYLIKDKLKLIGFLEIQKKEESLYVSKFFIIKKYREQGYGLKIIELLKKKAQKLNINSKFRLLTGKIKFILFFCPGVLP